MADNDSMTSTQRSHLIIMVVVVVLMVGGLIAMSSAISTSPDDGAEAGSTQPVEPESAEQQFASTCESRVNGAADCNCIVSQLESRGYSADADWQTMTASIGAAASAQQPAYAQAFGLCRP